MKAHLSVLLAFVVVAGCSARPETAQGAQPTVRSEPVVEKPESDTLPQAPEKRMTFTIRDRDVKEVIALIAKDSGKRIIASPEVKGKVTLSVNNVPWEDVLMAVARTLNYKTVPDGHDTIRVVPSE